MTLEEFLTTFHEETAGNTVSFEDFAQMAFERLTDTDKDETSLELYEAARLFLVAKDKLQQAMHEVEIDLE